MNIKKVRIGIINQIRRSPEKSDLRYIDYGKSSDIEQYSEEEIVEMIYGIYKDSKHLLVDGDYFVNLKDVVQAGCILETVTYYRKPLGKAILSNSHNSIQNIRFFYVKDYFLVTKNKVSGTDKHLITRYLWKTGAINRGNNRFVGLYSIANIERKMQKFKSGLVPKDLYEPIKMNINQVFFKDDNRISDFIVETDIQIENN
jgi:hypothetical protein